MTTFAPGSACRAEMTWVLRKSLHALSTRALLRLKLVQLPRSRAIGFSTGGGILVVTRVDPLAEQLPESEVALTVTSIVAPGATPVVSSTAVSPLPEMEPDDVVHS